jgi:hypothetical protein
MFCFVATGCAAGTAAKLGLMNDEAVEKYAGEGLKAFFKTLNDANEDRLKEKLPLVFHMGSCVDNSRCYDFTTALARQWDYDGAIIATSYAEILLSQAIRRYGAEQPVGYPDTGYYLPVIMCLSGEKVTKLGELVPILNRMRSQIKEELNFYNARLCGESTAYAAEIIEALRYLKGDKLHVDPWTGFLTDPVVRRYGILLVDWTIPGQAVMVGKAKSTEALAKIVSDLQGKGFMIFYHGLRGC